MSGKDAPQFDAVVRDVFPGLMVSLPLLFAAWNAVLAPSDCVAVSVQDEQPNLMSLKTTIFSPALLVVSLNSPCPFNKLIGVSFVASHAAATQGAGVPCGAEAWRVRHHVPACLPRRYG